MSECSCEVCLSACENKPGWFLPGEAEHAAALLGLPIMDFFNRYLAIDYWEDDGDLPQTFAIAPAVPGCEGKKYPWEPHGRCVLLDGDNDRCKIYEARPHECREYIHSDTRGAIDKRHRAIAKAWVDHQEQTIELLKGALR